MMTFFRSRRTAKEQAQVDSGGLKLHVAPDVKASLHAEGVVLIHLGKGTVFSANLAGARIWSGAAKRWSIQKLASSLAGEFHISVQAALQDAAEFLAQLEAEGLLLPDRS